MVAGTRKQKFVLIVYEYLINIKVDLSNKNEQKIEKL
jgi:hypothetical protein